MNSTAKLTSFVIFILVGSTVFSLTFRGVNGDLWVEHLLTGLPGGPIGFLIVVNALVFVLAFFLDFFELAFIIVPLLAPVADKLGIDLIWFGVLLGVNMQTSFLHPPFGFALFYLRSVAPAKAYLDKITGKLIAPVTTGQIYWGAVPFVVIQVDHGRDRDRVPADRHRHAAQERGRSVEDRDQHPSFGLRGDQGATRPDRAPKQDGKRRPARPARSVRVPRREATSRSCSSRKESKARAHFPTPSFE